MLVVGCNLGVVGFGCGDFVVDGVLCVGLWGDVGVFGGVVGGVGLFGLVGGNCVVVGGGVGVFFVGFVGFGVVCGGVWVGVLVGWCFLGCFGCGGFGVGFDFV